MSWQVYILRCKKGFLYTGITKNLRRRLREHKSGNGCKFTRYRIPVTLVFNEKAATRSAALRREAQIKRLPKQKKLQLVDG
ncbi:MAG: GIY-YIG nuclease family protein [Candidatus Omnitrophota bacterium]